MAELSACQKVQIDRQTDRQMAFQLYIVDSMWSSKTIDMFCNLLNFEMEISWDGPCAASYFLLDVWKWI